MKLLSILLIALIIVMAIMLPQIFFTVSETEVGIVTRFGQIKSEITSPGLRIKTPFIDQVTKFEKRLLIFDAPPDSLLTKDKKRLIIDVYARGRIVDPRVFKERLGDEQRATDRAVDIISSELRREIGIHNQSEIITTQRDLMMDNVKVAVTPKLLEFGIVVEDVRIKRADFPGEIADSVYARMQAERQRKADKERAEGAEIDAQVRADADRKATIILANATRDSQIINGCGEAEATRIFAEALEQDPEFYSFQRSLESFKYILGSGTTVVMPVEGFGKLFEEMRAGVDEATLVSSDSVTTDSSSDSVSSKCAEVSAAWYLAAELKVDQPDLTFVSQEAKEWSGVNLGCSDASDDNTVSVPGFEVEFLHGGSNYLVRSNQYGSIVAIC
ncbi:MAG: protease modulator HflC [Chloroflexota bacterium]|nr:protease modulator HflC [Chloroflexota bacterium]MED6295943.1 protease modulator HflC [Chloroflexota bacterium]